MKFSRLISCVTIGASLVGTGAAAYVAASANYRLELDSVNFGGGLSESLNYKVEDTLGEVGSGPGASSNYNLEAGYQQVTSSMFFLTAPATVDLSPDIRPGEQANGSGEWGMLTDNAAGYQLYVSADDTPALQGPSTVHDYVIDGVVPDFDWDIRALPAAFGFTPEGDDLATRYRDDGATCGTGSSDTTDACWDGLSASLRLIVDAASATAPTGATTTIKFRAEIGADDELDQGDYTAAITVTALPN